MPMCDAYIPAGALEPEAEKKLIARVTDILVEHEMRRFVDLMEPGTVKASHERASSIAWVFVHRTETYVAGVPIGLPVYKFLVTIPQGMIDDVFIPAMNRDVLEALSTAEGGRHPHLAQRLWTFVHEVPNGNWGAGGRAITVGNIADYVSPGLGKAADDRWAAKQRTDAGALVALANTCEKVAT
jgi:phenylpyruvate tautomerase PptA (4-oxalocrotonate tautomerase family)